jgi:hypothetical protein
VPNVSIVRRSWRTPPLILVEFRTADVVTLAGGLHDEDLVLKQENAGCNRHVGMPEEDVD